MATPMSEYKEHAYQLWKGLVQWNVVRVTATAHSPMIQAGATWSLVQ